MTAASARKGAALERSGSIVRSSGRDRARGRPPTGGRRSRRPPRRARGASRRSSRCGGARAPACRRGGRRRRARSGRRPAAAPRRTGRRRWRRSRPCRPGRRPSPRTVNGSASPSTATPRARSAVSTSPTGPVAHVGVAVEVDPPGREPGHRRQEPHHGAGQPAVDRGRAAQRAPGSPPSRHRRRRCRSPGPGGRRPSAWCRASAAGGVRRRGRRRAPPAPAPGWSSTCCRAARRPRRPARGRAEPATGRPSVRRSGCWSSPRAGYRWPSGLTRSWPPPAGPRGGRCRRGDGPRGGRRARRGGRARRRRACPRCRREAIIRPPSIETFLKKWIRWLARCCGVRLLPEAVAGRRGRHQRGGQHRGGQPGRAAGGEREAGADLGDAR